METKQKSVDGNENRSQLMETKTEVSRWKGKQKSVDGNETEVS
jgi:hypothetical protein